MSRINSSILWDYFDNTNTADKKAKCRVCGDMYSFKGTTGNLKAHLKKRHLDAYLGVVAGQQESRMSQTASILKKTTVWAEPCYTESITSEVPLTLVENKVKENEETPVSEENCEYLYDSDPIHNEDEEESEPVDEPKNPYDQLVNAKMDVVLLQKQLIHQQIREKILQNKIYEEEFKHKRQMHDLEKQHMLLKIELLKVELENARAKNCCTNV